MRPGSLLRSKLRDEKRIDSLPVSAPIPCLSCRKHTGMFSIECTSACEKFDTNLFWEGHPAYRSTRIISSPGGAA